MFTLLLKTDQSVFEVLLKHSHIFLLGSEYDFKQRAIYLQRPSKCERERNMMLRKRKCVQSFLNLKLAAEQIVQLEKQTKAGREPKIVFSP